MTYKEKENLLKIQNVTATMAIEGMYFNRDFLQKMMQQTELRKLCGLLIPQKLLLF